MARDHQIAKVEWCRGTAASLDPAKEIIPAGTPAYACPECKGKGTVTLFTSVSACRTCSGRGLSFKRYEPRITIAHDALVYIAPDSSLDLRISEYYQRELERLFDSFFMSALFSPAKARAAHPQPTPP